MKLITKIILWIIVSFLAVIALGTLPSFSSFTAIIIVLLVAPIERWQNFLQKYIKGKIKIIAIVVLSILMFAAFPNSDASVNTDIPSETTTAPTTEPTTAPTTAPTTEPTTAPTTEPTTAPTTEPPHTHSFSSATCTTPKTCSCGATEGEANGHSWKNATCQAPKTCTICGITEGTTADHSWSAATCTAPQKCKTCSAEKGSAIGHNYNQGTCLICGSKDPDYVEITYVLNTYTMKFHRPSCRKLPTDNRKDTTMSREEVIAAGYDACGICHP